MANEISISASVSASKNGLTMSQSGSKTVDMAGDDMIQSTQVVGITAEAIGFGEITGAPSVVQLRNVETVNFVLYGPSNPPTEFKLPAGHVALFQPSAATLYAIASPGTARILVFATEA
jgi:hypothetical protein